MQLNMILILRSIHELPPARVSGSVYRGGWGRPVFECLENFIYEHPRRDLGQLKAQGPISQVLTPVRGRLITAAVLAASGSMLTLVPLAVIERIARLALGDATHVAGDIGWLLLVGVASLFCGMALLCAGELQAHLADNRITHQLRLAIVQRLTLVPLGWFTGRASGRSSGRCRTTSARCTT